MEQLGRELVASNSVQVVSKVYDQYLDFVGLEQRVFTLNRPNSYLAYNRQGVTDAEVQKTINVFAHGLFSVVATLGVIPIIRCPTGGASEFVAQQLNGLLEQAIHGSASSFFESGSTVSSRPLLVILERANDFVTPLHHTLTYQAILNDILDYRMNRIHLGAGKPVYELESDTDPFWRKTALWPFPEAIEEISKATEACRLKEKEIKDKTGGCVEDSGAPTQVNGDVNGVAPPPEGGGTQDLLATVDSLPQLLERKAKLEVHTKILEAAMGVLKARDLPVFFEAEQGALSGRPDKAMLQQLIGAQSKGSLADKIRLLALYSMSEAAASDPNSASELEEALRSSIKNQEGGAPSELEAQFEAGVASIRHMRQIQSFQQPTQQQQGEGGSNTGSGSSGLSGLTSLMTNATSQASGFLSAAAQRVGLGKNDDKYACRVVHNLCEFRPGTEDESFLYLDARGNNQTASSIVAPGNRAARVPFKQVMVFMVGGGCLAEHQALQDYSQRHPERQITYGCTEMLNAENFLTQLGKL